MRNLDRLRNPPRDRSRSRIAHLAAGSAWRRRCNDIPVMNRKPSTKKLVVKKQTLRTLASDELAEVQGGKPVPQNNCTLNFSGCISQC